MNIKNILSNSTTELIKAGIKTASLDAIVLLEHVINKNRQYILTHNLEPITNSEYAKFRKLISRRKKGEPVAYLTGHKEFYGYDFFVNKNVLIPRPETELIVENAVHFLELRKTNNKLCNKEIKIIDIGTGSGCIIISLILALKASSYKLEAGFFASDISKKALYVARKNAKLHKVNKKIRFYLSDLFSNKQLPKKYDLIIANLPYVPKPMLNVKCQMSDAINPIYFEPEEAIFAEDNGAQVIKKFLDQVKNRINPNSLILIEVDPRNANELFLLGKKIFKNSQVDLTKDLANLDRVIKILI